ncbi:hypothetical protein [Pseudomonas sp. 5P_3.1_Bac2]|uniref:hypothetical protein n=1 Tax=Pseudomonas sp. 5P_3.1_Bac2 TaxID=2971617 RepID=UPI0021C8D83F|nr:hypothetical protein [Pseudomonas sp. 5P_3.1_Bac2]MCU1717817.1 hypothetical protein [Pseudomonas sp. 5P_3.1_Bac2]
MKKIIIIISAIALSSCMKDHGQKAADLEFISINKDTQTHFYTVSFRSNIELLNLFKPSQDMSVISKQLICSLDTPAIFEMDKRIDSYAIGDFQRSHNEQFSYEYEASIYFAQTKAQGTSFDYLKENYLKKQLAERISLPCKVKITLYPYRAYYSNTLTIPTQQILEAIK